MADASGRLQARTTRTGSTNRPSKLPSSPNQFGEDDHFYLSAAPEPARREGRRSRRPTATSRPSSSSKCSAPAWTRARRRSACATRGDSGADSARARRTPVHGRRRLPELARVLGPERACCSSATSRCSGTFDKDGDSNATRRDRGAWRQRRRGRARGPHRTAERQGRFPAPDFTGHYRMAGTGATCRSPACCGRSTGTTSLPNDQFDLSGQRRGWGINVSSNIKANDERHASPAGHIRRGHPELLQRRAGRRRHQEESGESRDTPSSAKRCRSSACCRISITTGTTSGRRRPDTRAWTSTTATGRRRTPTSRAIRVGQSSLHARAERDDGRRVAVGAPRQLLRRLPRRTTSSSSSRSNTTSR